MATTSSSSSSVPDSASWSTLGSRFNIDGGRPPTLPAHYWPLETYVLPRIKSLLTTSPTSSVKVLILAGGTGAELEVLMEGLEKEGLEKMKGRVKVTQTDTAQGMLGVAEELVKKRGWGDSVECKVLDAQDTGLKSNSYDVILLFYGPHCLPSPNIGLREAYRLLTPGGLFVFTTPYDLTVWDIVTEAHDRTLLRRPEGSAGRDLVGQHVFKTAEMMKPWVDLTKIRQRIHDELGWKQAKVETNKVTTFVADYESLFKSFHGNPGMAFIYRGLEDEGERGEMYEEMLRICRERVGDGEGEGEGERKKGMEMEITSAVITVTK